MHGQFLLVQLETPEEAVLGRITALSSQGKLSQGSGEEFNIRAVRDGRSVPDDLREQYLKYHVDIRVLGVLRNGAGNRLDFVPSHRRLPHVGSPVAFLSDDVLKEVVGSNDDGVCIGHFALGEYVYDPSRAKREAWMRLKSPEARVTFNIQELISRRSFIFARAGFGKSNLNKLLFGELYRQQPAVKKRGERQVPVGTVIFDPDGEYFWPDDKGRPGLCDVPHLEHRLVVFTSRGAPSRFYEAFVASRVKLDIRELRPSDVISIALPPERQEQQNVTKLRSLPQDRWRELVDLVHRDGNGADPEKIAELLNVEFDKQQAEVIAARSNMATTVRMLHDPSSQMMGLLLNALRAGKLCVVDVSQMRGTQGYVLSGIILRQIFSKNQEEFTKAEPETIPTIAVIEEAQSVLNERAAAAEPFIAWVKEGRKYDLGAVLVTQQPGSIPDEILSLNQILKAEQQYNENFAYAYNSLRAYPLVRMSYFGEEAFVCPIPTLLFWKITGGLYYELVDDPRFANEFGDAFQTYVGDVIECACPNPKIQRLAEQEYSVGKQRKRTVDWIVADEQAALFLECKVKRLAFGAKVSLTDLGPLEAEIDNMATAVVQIYKTISDYLDNRYSHFPVKQGRKIYPAVVTLENWHMFGPVMLTNLEEVVTTKLKEAALPPEWANEMRYSVWPVEELEVGLQIVNSVPIADFVDRKLNDPEMKRWAWHPYMTKCFSQHFPAKMLFLKEFDDIFANLLAAERLGN
jgi:uncharacterized protein DUF87